MRWIAAKGSAFSGAPTLTPFVPMLGARSARWHYAHSAVRHPSSGSKMANLRSSALCAGTKQKPFAVASAIEIDKDNASQNFQKISISDVSQAICDVQTSCPASPAFLDGVYDHGLRNGGRGTPFCCSADSVLSREDRENRRRWDSWRNG